MPGAKTNIHETLKAVRNGTATAEQRAAVQAQRKIAARAGRDKGYPTNVTRRES